MVSQTSEKKYDIKKDVSAEAIKKYVPNQAVEDDEPNEPIMEPCAEPQSVTKKR